MASYLERYQQGEYVEVWQELAALGDRVRAEPNYSDAQAVAQETMQRVRRNLELIHSRLQDIGYEFQFPAKAVSPPLREQIAELDEFEREVGYVPLSLRAWAEVVGSVNFMGNYPRLSFCEDEYNPFLGSQFAIGPGGQPQMLDLASLMPTQAELDSIPPEYDDALSSIRGAFANLMGAGSLAGLGMTEAPPEQHQAKPQPMENVAQEVLSNMRRAFAKATDPSREQDNDRIPAQDRVLSDPLVVELCGLSMEQYEAWQELDNEEIPFSVIVSPDVREKANLSGDRSYEVELPDAAADVLVRNTVGEDILFVEYLRSSLLEWASFRELRNYAQRDATLLHSLKEGLLPF